jgi:hypothetical protein
MEAANRALTASEKALRTEKRHLQSANRWAQDKLGDTQARQQTVERELKHVRRQLRANSTRLSQNRRELSEKRKRIQEIQKQLRLLAARERDLRFRVERLALTDVKVREGEELGRLTVAAGSSMEETRSQVERLVTRVRQLARERGARRSGALLEAYLQNKRLADMLGPTTDGPIVAERDVIRLLSRLVSDSDADVVLRAQAVQNTAEGEPVPFDINPYWNVLAFRKGEEIASATLDPELSSGQILEQLAVLLRTKVRRKASVERQMIPGPRNELGEVRYDPLLEVAEKVKALGAPAKVGVVAAREVRVADPLEIDFYVVPAEKAVAARASHVSDGER